MEAKFLGDMSPSLETSGVEICYYCESELLPGTNKCPICFDGMNKSIVQLSTQYKKNISDFNEDDISLDLNTRNSLYVKTDITEKGVAINVLSMFRKDHEITNDECCLPCTDDIKITTENPNEQHSSCIDYRCRVGTQTQTSLIYHQKESCKSFHIEETIRKPIEGVIENRLTENNTEEIGKISQHTSLRTSLQKVQSSSWVCKVCTTENSHNQMNCATCFKPFSINSSKRNSVNTNSVIKQQQPMNDAKKIEKKGKSLSCCKFKKREKKK